MRPKHASLVMASLSFLFAGPALAIEPDSFIPPETAFVAQIRPKQLLRSSLFKEQGWDKALQTTFECVGPVAEFLETASLCFDRDLESILFCLPFTPLLQAVTPDAVGIDQKTGEALRLDSKEWNPPWLLVVRGTFQPKKIIQALENHGKTNGSPVHKWKESQHRFLELATEHGPVFVAFDRPNSIFISNRQKHVRSCLVAGFNKPVSKNLQSALDGIDPNATLWAAAGFTERPGNKQAFPNDPSQLPIVGDLNGGRVSLAVQDGFALALNIQTKSRETAEFIHESVIGQIREMEHNLKESWKEDKTGTKNPPDLVERIANLGIAQLLGRHSAISLQGSVFSVKTAMDRKAFDRFLEGLIRSVQ